MPVKTVIFRLFKGLATAFMVATLLSACAGIPKGLSPNDDFESSSSETFTDTYLVNDFPEVSSNDILSSTQADVFRVGDTASVSIYNVDSLSADYVVDRAGNVVFPLIGTIEVAGLTTLDLQEVLTLRYGSSYLQNPGISVKIDARDIGKIVVDGAVNKPGVFEVSDIIQLTEAVALAQGLTLDASKKDVYIIRNIEGQRKVRSVNLDNIRKLGAPDPKLIPNDVVYVQNSNTRVAFRELLRTIPLLNTAYILSTR